MKKTLCVLFGGVSSEYEVSLCSAASVLKNCDPDTYTLLPVGVTKDGHWLLYGGTDFEAISEDRWQEHSDNRPAILSPDRGTHGLVLGGARGFEALRVDCVFPVLHGANGEDGTVQGLLELAGIPYVGCGVAASANAMDKSITKLFAEKAGLTQAKWKLLDSSVFFGDEQSLTAALISELGLPLFVKPARTGSSVGISKVKTGEALSAAVREAARHDRKILFEEFIDGQEIEVSVLGDCRGSKTSICGEIRPAREFYSYEAKYIDGDSELIIPARLPEDTSARVREAASRIFHAIDGFGLSRADFFVRRTDGAVIFNEINTIPGFTRISMYPKLWEKSGLPYPHLIDRLVELALTRGENDRADTV